MYKIIETEKFHIKMNEAFFPTSNQACADKIM
jgi:hypothetical protein